MRSKHQSAVRNLSWSCGQYFFEVHLRRAAFNRNSVWFPVALLAPCGPCAWALVHDLHSEHGKRINGTMMQVMDWQPDKLLLQKLCGSQILVSKHKCHVFATPQLAEAGMRKRLLLRGHSDKQGDRHMFDLAMLLA